MPAPSDIRSSGRLRAGALHASGTGMATSRRTCTAGSPRWVTAAGLLAPGVTSGLRATTRAVAGSPFLAAVAAFSGGSSQSRATCAPTRGSYRSTRRCCGSPRTSLTCTPINGGETERSDESLAGKAAPCTAGQAPIRCEERPPRFSPLACSAVRCGAQDDRDSFAPSTMRWLVSSAADLLISGARGMISCSSASLLPASGADRFATSRDDHEVKPQAVWRLRFG